MVQNFFSPGKLLLTAEYFVLDGALALAVPTKLGQEMSVKHVNDGKNLIHWKALHQNKPWLELTVDRTKWEILNSNNQSAAIFVKNLLLGVEERSPSIFQNNTSYHFQTNLQFPGNYGLGSSSTLLVNLAEWAEIDPYELNKTFLKGSGYDIAVALEKSTILFKNDPEIVVNKIDFEPKYKDQLVFIHLNQKQDSRKGIGLYRSKEKSESLIDQFSILTRHLVEAETIAEFSQIITEHEQKVSRFLGIPTVKELLFQDYPESIKSLGAWGGDFILAVKSDGWKDYFEERKFRDYFEWNALIDSN